MKQKTKINLSEYRHQIFSQFAECGIIDKLFDIMNIRSGWLVEFGAWEGLYLSNTANQRQKNNSFKNLLIEPDTDRFKELTENVPWNDNNILLNCYVELEGENSLNSIFKKYVGSEQISLISIDVDGLDLEIWKSLDVTAYRPAIVIIECGNWQDEQKLNELNEIFSNRHYNLVYVTGNFIFVDAVYGIKSTETIHQLLRKSGNPENLQYFREITEEQAKAYYDRAHAGENIYMKLCGPQEIEF